MADNNPENIRQSTQAQSQFAQASEVAREITARITQEARDLNAELRDQLGIQRTRSDEDRTLIKLSQDLTRSAALNNVELRRSNELNKQLVKDNKNLTQLVNEQTILYNSLTDEQIENADRINLANQDRIAAENEIIRLTRSLAFASSDQVDSIKELIKEKKKNVVNAEKELRIALDASDAESQRLALVDQTIDKQNELITSRRQELKVAAAVNENLGLTGAILDNLNKAGLRAFGGLGINLGTFQESLSETINEVNVLAEDLTTKQGSIFGKQLKVFSAAAKGTGKALGAALFDPLTVGKTLLDQFFAVEKAAVDLSRTTGQSFGELDGLNSRFATAVDLAEAITAETKQSGLNANNIFSKDVLAGAAEFKNQLGGSSEEIAGLLSLTAATGMNTEAIQESIVDTTSAFNGANKAAVSQRMVLEDVLTSSTSIQASLAGNPKALAEAASAARRLGLSLKEVDNIADSLLDFESSINSELEAQLLTGRNINLAKARELALNNDLAGLSNEIFKNQVSVSEFSRMNRIQQDALAKSLGISRDQLANMAFQQAKLNGLTGEQAAAAAGVSLEDMERVAATEALQKSLEKLLQTVAPVFDIFSKIVGFTAQFPNLTSALIGVGVVFKLMRKRATAAAAAQATQVAATAAQTGANTAMAASQSAVGATGTAAAAGARAFGGGLTALGSSGAVAVPVLLSVAAVAASVGLAFLGIGAGIKMAAEGFVLLFSTLTLDQIKVVAAAVVAFTALGGALALLGSAGLVGLPMLITLVPVLAGLGAIAGLGAAGDAGEAEAQNTMAKVEEKLDKLIAVVEKGGNVYLDGNLVGIATVLGTFKSR